MPQFTINTTPAHAQRIAKAFGQRLSLVTNDKPPVPRDATAAEIKDAVIKFLKETVLMFEQREAEQTARNNVPKINPT